ncbi:MAG: response regulator [Marinilabiliales bacterium]|nr:response regulator [Marinilabiliales bacterium]
MDEATGIEQIRVVLVDDEEHCRMALKRVIDNHIPDISLLAMGTNVSEGIRLIDEHKPELVFLDIELPDGNGFDIIDLTNWKGYQVIFITSHNEFALKAFEVSAIQYLLKPVSIIDLKNAVDRYKQFKTDNLYPKKTEVMKQNLSGQKQPE